MKIVTVSMLTALLAVSTIVPVVSAQRSGRGGGGGGGQNSRSGQAAPRPPSNSGPNTNRPNSSRPNTVTSTPSSPILPMTNPVIPMTNPIAPFVQYGGAAGAARGSSVQGGRNNGPGRGFDPRSHDRNDGRNFDHRRDNFATVIGGIYVPWDWWLYEPYTYQPYMYPAPIPGQLPGTYYNPDYYTDAPPPANVEPLPPVIVPQEPTYYNEPRIIVPAGVPLPPLERPAIGTTRAEVLARLGDPWGSISTLGKETLYFRGDLVVVLQDGRVIEVR